MQKGKDKVRRDISLIYPAWQALGMNGHKRGRGTRGTHARESVSFTRPVLSCVHYFEAPAMQATLMEQNVEKRESDIFQHK